MNHKELMQELQRRLRLDKQQAALLMTCLERILVEEGVATHEVIWAGMGRFLSHKHPEYIEENAATGQTILYPPRITYRFQADRTLADNGLAEKLTARSGIDSETVSAFLTGLAKGITDALERGEEVLVNGLGSFTMIDVRQGETRRVAYLPDEKMREAVNAPFNCFEPMVIDATSEVPDTPDSPESPESPDIPETPDTPEPPEPAPIPDEAAEDNRKRVPYAWIIAAVLLTAAVAGIAIWMFVPNQETEPARVKNTSTPASQIPSAVTDTLIAEADSTQRPDTLLTAAETAVPGDSLSEPHARVSGTAATQPVEPPAEQQLLKENGVPVREVLGEGERLTLVALKYYGSKAFWPYIYEVNRFQIKDPNNVPAGINLYLPDPVYWNIDSASENSLAKAKIKAAKLINRQ